MDDHKTTALTRRTFLLQSGTTLATFAAANVGVYIVGSAFKDLDGSMVAGAKCVIGTCLCNDMAQPAAANSGVCAIKCDAGHGGMAEFCDTGLEW